MNTLFLFALLSLSLAAYPVDFASHAPREADDAGVLPAFWLEAGVYHADVSSRTELNSSYLELQFSPEQQDVECFYTVWFNGNKIVWGNFNTATSSVIPVIGKGALELVDGEENTLTVSVANCYLGRFAIPYTLGDNGNALYLVSLHPEDQEEIFTSDQTTNTDETIKNYYPGFEFNHGYEGVESWNEAIGHSGLCKFSSQACTVSDGGFWMPSYHGYAGVKIDWTDATFYDDDNFEGEVVIEHDAWFSLYFIAAYYHCNSTEATGGKCDSDEDINNFAGLAYGKYEFSAEVQAEHVSAGDSDSFWVLDAINDKKRNVQAVSPQQNFYDSQGTRAFALNSSRHYYRNHYLFTIDDGEDLEESLFIYFTPNQVVFPYAKVWALGFTDPIHILADLRDLSESSECHLETGGDGNTAEAEVGWPTYGMANLVYDEQYAYAGWPGAYPHLGGNDESGSYNGVNNPDQAFIYCGQDPAGDNTLTCDQVTAQYVDDLDLEEGDELETEPVTVTNINLPFGGYINPVVMDLGMPTVYTAVCDYDSWYNEYYEPLIDYAEYFPFAANQLSSYDFLVNGKVVGHHEQTFIKRFDRHQISGFGVEGFVLETNSTNLEFSYKSSPGLSITATAFIQINAFPDVMCVDDDCGAHGHCADAYVSAACECDITHMGDACDELVPFCSAEDSTFGCMNGGVCVENEDRKIVTDVGGFAELIIDATWCNCSGTMDNVEDATGDFRGKFCEIPAPCNRNPCLNSGVCENGDDQSYTCNCEETESPISGEPFTGDHCEFPATTVCDQNPCENGGACLVDEDAAGGYTCGCINGWEGATCTVAPTDGCSKSTDHCKPYGYCVSGSNPDSDPAFTECVCMYGYTGTTCSDKPTACANVECQNEGSCIGFGKADTAAWACLCVDPWVGQNCQWNATFEAVTPDK